eukprot:4150947-Amphidinium_carterae.1
MKRHREGLAAQAAREEKERKVKARHLFPERQSRDNETSVRHVVQSRGRIGLTDLELCPLDD